MLCIDQTTDPELRIRRLAHGLAFNRSLSAHEAAEIAGYLKALADQRAAGRKSKARFALDAINAQHVKHMYKRGSTIAQIMTALNLSRVTIWTILHDAALLREGD